jgi:hypothetical protein
MATVVVSVEGVLTGTDPSTDIMYCDASKAGRILYQMIRNDSRILLLSSEANVAKVKGWLARERFTKYADVHCYPDDSPLTAAQWKVQHIRDLVGVGHHIEFFIDSDPDTIKMAVESGITGLLMIYSGVLPGRSETSKGYSSWYDLVDTIETHSMLRANKILKDEEN